MWSIAGQTPTLEPENERGCDLKGDLIVSQDDRYSNFLIGKELSITYKLTCEPEDLVCVTFLESDQSCYYLKGFNSIPYGKPLDFQLYISSDQNDIMFNSTKQVSFTELNQTAIIEWEFKPQISGKYHISVKGPIEIYVLINVKEPRNYSPPLKQIHAGRSVDKITCNEGLYLAYKKNDLPICLKFETAINLWESSWLDKKPDIYSKFIKKEISDRFHSLLISKEKALDEVQNYLDENKSVLHYEQTDIMKADLIYMLPSQKDYSYHSVLLELDPQTAMPIELMPPWQTKYYENPQWWSELQKDYVGLQNDRIEEGVVLWKIWAKASDKYHQNLDACFFVDPIKSEVLSDYRFCGNKYFKSIQAKSKTR